MIASSALIGGMVALASPAAAATPCGRYQTMLTAAATMNSLFLDQGDTQNAMLWNNVYDQIQAQADAAGCY